MKVRMMGRMEFLPLLQGQGCRLDHRPLKSDAHLLLIHTPLAVEILAIHLALR
jgi:hypothetical protein